MNSIIDNWDVGINIRIFKVCSFLKPGSSKDKDILIIERETYRVAYFARSLDVFKKRPVIELDIIPLNRADHLHRLCLVV